MSTTIVRLALYLHVDLGGVSVWDWERSPSSAEVLLRPAMESLRVASELVLELDVGLVLGLELDLVKKLEKERPYSCSRSLDWIEEERKGIVIRIFVVVWCNLSEDRS